MYRVFSDGGSRGNPGPSAYAIVVTKDDRIVHEHSEFLGINTNNYAEYRGLIAGLTKALELKADEVEFVMDSQLVIKQMTGEYKVKNENIKNLYLDAKALSSMIPKVSFRNVRRSELLIPRADALLNKELDMHQ
ncbi:MAG: ribonuclease HI family protein [Candidatus Methanoplasma sp.]|jgi:ribonuclease HI|nr:ribonuclease HI family protein [Candidatus Methanoplasma sp.]